jgi:hypothetical protein
MPDLFFGADLYLTPEELEIGRPILEAFGVGVRVGHLVNGQREVYLDATEEQKTKLRAALAEHESVFKE